LLGISHLIRLLEEGCTDAFPAVFDVAKRVLSEGDEEARSLVCDGFVRDLISTELFVA
jgi:hypothetical protein